MRRVTLLLQWHRRRRGQPEGNLFRDRFLSMQHRALIEPRVPVLCVFPWLSLSPQLDLIVTDADQKSASRQWNTKSMHGSGLSEHDLPIYHEGARSLKLALFHHVALAELQ